MIIADYTISINEFPENDTLLAQIAITNAEWYQVQEISLIAGNTSPNGNNPPFKVALCAPDAEYLDILLSCNDKRSLDYFAQEKFELTLETKFISGFTVQSKVTVNLLNTNSPPLIVGDSNFTIIRDNLFIDYIIPQSLTITDTNPISGVSQNPDTLICVIQHATESKYNNTLSIVNNGNGNFSLKLSDLTIFTDDHNEHYDHVEITHSFRLTATDNRGTSGTFDFSITHIIESLRPGIVFLPKGGRVTHISYDANLTSKVYIFRYEDPFTGKVNGVLPDDTRFVGDLPYYAAHLPSSSILSATVGGGNGTVWGPWPLTPGYYSAYYISDVGHANERWYPFSANDLTIATSQPHGYYDRWLHALLLDDGATNPDKDYNDAKVHFVENT